MDIYKSVSEKITFKNQADQFHSREFSASRKITVPDDSKLEFIRYTEIALDYDLRKQVLTNFVLESVMTGEQMQKTLEPYKMLLDKAEATVKGE